VNPLQFILLLLLRGYQALISPLLVMLHGPGCGCRFSPTCSQYAIDALRLHGVTRGVWLAGRRLCRCHPWGGCGDDPVPPPPPVHDAPAPSRIS